MKSLEIFLKRLFTPKAELYELILKLSRDLANMTAWYEKLTIRFNMKTQRLGELRRENFLLKKRIAELEARNV